MAKQSSPDRFIDALMTYGPCLPLELTHKNPSPAIRVAGLLIYCVWCVPAFMVVCIPVIVLIFSSFFVEAYRGDL